MMPVDPDMDDPEVIDFWRDLEQQPRSANVEARFWAKVAKGDGCWVWTAARQTAGYGVFRVRPGKAVLAHRLSYEAVHGPIPEALVIDHLCRNRACVRPDHLEAVTQRDNILRGVGYCAAAARQTSCKRGHPFDETNTAWQANGSRQCRECNRMRARGEI